MALTLLLDEVGDRNFPVHETCFPAMALFQHADFEADVKCASGTRHAHDL